MRNRLHALCPYFAMFPESFVEEHLARYTGAGDLIYDPFSGRGTTLLQALLMGRTAVASDINPVAFCITNAKAHAPDLRLVLGELDVLEQELSAYPVHELDEQCDALSFFFHMCFHRSTLRALLFLRSRLRWRSDHVHGFIAALLLGSLHGEADKSRSYFSNQMPRIISTKPGYSIRYWLRHRMWPEARDVFAILRSRARLRLSGSAPQRTGVVELLDVRCARRVFTFAERQVAAVVTSPPYFNTTNYEEDQWLRLWFLGHLAKPTYGRISRDDRWTSRVGYWGFLKEAWAGLGSLLKDDGVLVCRMGGNGLSADDITNELQATVRAVFPEASLIMRRDASKPVKKQTERFRPGAAGCSFEIDFAFQVGR